MKTYLKVVGGFQVFDLIVYDFGARNISLILYGYDTGFVKVNAGALRRFQLYEFVVFLCVV